MMFAFNFSKFVQARALTDSWLIYNADLNGNEEERHTVGLLKCGTTKMTVDIAQAEDRLLMRKVKTAIHGLGYVKLRRILCHCKDKTVLLAGVTDSFYMKQIIYAAASKVPGVEAVIDQIVVVDD
jgi:osmotically-inducible protein OsmY